MKNKKQKSEATNVRKMAIMQTSVTKRTSRMRWQYEKGGYCWTAIPQ